MRFAHMADCHLGAWRDPKMRAVNLEAFCRAIAEMIEEKVDFVLISGDLFNTSLPPLDILKTTVQKLRLLQKKDIPVYIIAGSHDFSPSGKTILDVLEEAGLVVNVVRGDIVDGKLQLRFTEHEAGVFITGMLGRKGMLERSYYESLDISRLKGEGFKIFMFHTALEEFKPKELEKMDAAPLSLLPKGFDYYAGGHVHSPLETSEEGYKHIVFPGPLFPNSFSELEQLKRGGYFLYDDGKITFKPIQVYNVFTLDIDAQHRLPEQVTSDILERIEDKEFTHTIVLIRVSGTLEAGKPSDIGFPEIFSRLHEKSAYFVMKNTSALKSKEFEEVKLEQKSVSEMEDGLIREHLGQIKVSGDEKALIKGLMSTLDEEKHEGERKQDFEQRILAALDGQH
ncbi:MAG: DNA repair exonuclease [Nanoarchaeota archaeon]|nr:DNA repair exonuclease [Nanoarchaeota archaeon]